MAVLVLTHHKCCRQIETFWAAGKNWAAQCYRTNRTMKEAVMQVRAGWYGAEAKSVGVAGGPRKKAVNCDGLIEKAIDEAQKMVDGFKGLGVWGDLRCRDPDGEEPRLQFGFSGQRPDDDATGWDDELAGRLSKKDCAHISAGNAAAARRHGLEAVEQPAPLQQHRRSPVRVIELDSSRKLRWADVAEIAVADLTKPDLGLVASDDDDHHAASEGGGAVSMLLAVLEGPEVESESTNDEQNMSDVLGHGDPLPGGR
jgi:hypothetical protein